jgi:hypothetical protein
MPKTPDEISRLHTQSVEREAWLFDKDVAPRDILMLYQRDRFKTIGNPLDTEAHHKLILAALNLKIADNATESAAKLFDQTTKLTNKICELGVISGDQKNLSEHLNTETRRLVEQVVLLAAISKEQCQFAAKLDKQTKSLIRLTWAIVLLTVALLASEVRKIIVGENAKANIQHVQTP